MGKSKDKSAELKGTVVKNQAVIDELNADLSRKTREVRIIQEVLSEIVSLDLNKILQNILDALARNFDFKYSMILLADEERNVLRVSASHGYKKKGVGLEVPFGVGVIGMVAKKKKLMRMGNIGTQKNYLNAVRAQFSRSGRAEQLKDFFKLPGLEDVQSQVAIPLTTQDKLIGVISVESNEQNFFSAQDEFIVKLLAEQAAIAIEKARLYTSEKEKHDALGKALSELRALNEQLEQKVNERTTEIRQKNRKLEAVNEVLKVKNKEITDSISYARQIQEAVFPSLKMLRERLPDSFVFYRPRDVVSGDFYWYHIAGSRIMIVAADCTGHGVPGALLSMLGNLFLKELTVTSEQMLKPAEVLRGLQQKFYQTFDRQNVGHLKDGMDIGLCMIDTDFFKVFYAGANRPLYRLRQGDIEVFPGDRIAIGEYRDTHEHFNQHEIEYQSGDAFYLFSDGYVDQFGGPKGKKFLTKRFQGLLKDNAHCSMKEQEQALDKQLKSWCGNEPQVDDILVIGFRP